MLRNSFGWPTALVAAALRDGAAAPDSACFARPSQPHPACASFLRFACATLPEGRMPRRAPGRVAKSPAARLAACRDRVLGLHTHSHLTRGEGIACTAGSGSMPIFNIWLTLCFTL